MATTEALRRLAPLDVCLVLDDVHRIADGSSGGRLLARLVAALPANIHLVLAGRALPDLPLARLHAGDHLVELAEDELAFRTGEIERLAAGFGRQASTAAGFGGWPALVRVALAARQGSPSTTPARVLADLDRPTGGRCSRWRRSGRPTRASCHASSVGRRSSPAWPGRCRWCRRSTTSGYRGPRPGLDTRWRVVETGEAAAIRGAAIDELLATGQVAQAGDVAIAAGDAAALSLAAMALVRSTISVLPVELARRWLVAAAALPSSPELRLLEAACRAATDFADRAVDGSSMRSPTSSAPGRPGSARSPRSLSARWPRRPRRLRAGSSRLALRTAGVPAAGDDPVVRLAACSIAAVVAEMQGDPERAVEEFAVLTTDGLPVALAVSADRFLMHCLLLARTARTTP